MKTRFQVRQLKEMIDSRGLQVGIEMDGGIGPDNIGAAIEAGANIFVAGSAIFGQPDYRQVISRMKSSFPA